jgi:glycosyltransferase involved in cell wall biosynthesis
MSDLPSISVIVCTRDRPKDLAALLQTVLHQDYLPLEVIVVDDSPHHSSEIVVNLYSSKFESAGCSLKYVPGSGDGLPAARNLGIKIASGDAILFLDDDTLLSDKNVLRVIAEFLGKNSDVLGLQPLITSQNDYITESKLANKLENAIYKVLMLSYRKDNILAVRRSGANIFPSTLSKVIEAQRLSGCCCCYRREIFSQFEFDTNLKRWGYMEDLDFSYRVYKKYPGSLYAIPFTKIVHKHSAEGRMATKTTIYMSTIYWFYIFFKDIFEASIFNLIAFMWALAGNLIASVGGLLFKRKPKKEWWNIIWLLAAYIIAFKNFRSIIRRDLTFFNKRFLVKSELNAA